MDPSFPVIPSLRAAAVSESSHSGNGSDGDAKPSAKRRRRLLNEIMDYNKVGGWPEEKEPLFRAVGPAVSVTPIAKTTAAATASSGKRSSARAQTRTQRFLDPIDGCELDTTPKRRCNRASDTSIIAVTLIQKGSRFCKKFGQDYFWGAVSSDFPRVEEGEVRWEVRYDDGDREELEKKELRQLIQFERARKDLCYKVGVLPQEALVVLEKMSPPYGLNQAMRAIHKLKGSYQEREDDDDDDCGPVKFEAKIGLKIRKNFFGAAYDGTVVSGPEEVIADDGTPLKVWAVKFEDGEVDDMEYEDLFRWRANRPNRPHWSGGRQFCALELFGGLGIVSQAFDEKRWRVQSVDNNPDSHATMAVDIMDLVYDDIAMVPDFIWASPPCETYSRLSGTKHRDPKGNLFEKTDKARLHNQLLLNLMCIIEWTRKKNPHLIVVIENPEAMLREMPLMEEKCNQLGLKKTTVHYCAFGAPEKKPTNLWSNDLNLLSRLGEFRCCAEKCPYGVGGHPRGARGNTQKYHAAAIPEGLAELVARYVDSKLFLDRVNETRPSEVSEEDKEELNSKLRGEKPPQYIV